MLVSYSLLHPQTDFRNRCIICRRNKLKCDGQTPCQRCQTVNKPCQYPEQDALNSEVATSRDRVGFLEELLQCLRPDIETDVESLRSHVLALREISRQPMAVEAGEHSTQTPESHFSPSKSLSKALVDGESGPIVLEAANAHATSIMVHNQGKTRKFPSAHILVVERFMNLRF